MTKRTLLGAFVLGMAAFGYTRPAEAGMFISLSANASTISCDNGTAAGVTACTTAGFVTSLNSDSIAFNGSVGGYTMGSLDLGSNGPGSSTLGFALDDKFDLTHTAGAGALTVDFAAYDFTLPIGPSLFLSASQTANWTTSTAGDSQTFQTWGRPDDSPTVPGGGVGGVTTTTAACVSPGGLTTPCAMAAPVVAFTRLVTDYALTGQEVISEAIGTVGSYTGTVAALANNPTTVPEPTSLLLLGTGLFALARFRTRKA